MGEHALPPREPQAFAEWRTRQVVEAARMARDARARRRQLIAELHDPNWAKLAAPGGRWPGFERPADADPQNSERPSATCASGPSLGCLDPTADSAGGNFLRDVSAELPPRPEGVGGLGKIASSDSPHVGWSPASGRKHGRYVAQTEVRELAPRTPSWDGSGVMVRGRVGRCGLKRISASVQMHATETGIVIVGVERCGSVHACPVCAAPIYAERAEEIQRLVAHFGPERCSMLTLTIRHDRWSSLGTMEDGIQRAWRLFWASGKASMRARRAMGIEHYVKTLEHTHGPMGWHPHIHMLWVAREGHTPPVDLEKRLAEHWQECVRKALGSRYKPSVERGVRITGIGDDDRYLAKLGLEIAGITTKAGRTDGHRSSWGVCLDAAAGDVESRRLWSEYVEHTHGRRLMTWSRGTKRELNIAHKSDENIVDEEAEQAYTRELLVTYDADTWDEAVRQGRDLELIEAAADILRARDGPRARSGP